MKYPQRNINLHGTRFIDAKVLADRLQEMINDDVHPDIRQYRRQQAVLRRLPPIGAIGYPYGWIGPGPQFR